ncbi:UNVERIFIED_CONTAM: LINE-1 retrotransposable element O protein [Sesamum calycinum]|uniref:LINE-1 retrotransposable element O protein n=1 Tax=Sesamum calycinum TaxID=2727403 RepID=A0AAW2KE92_9LAMI
MEEDFCRQKAICKWIDEGERNTKFFHSLVKKKRSSSKIHSICHQGQHISDPNEIIESAALFFEELLTNNLVLETDNLSFLNHSVSQQDNDMLCCLPTIEEVKSAIFDMCPDSAAGPDGFSALFYQVCWEIIAQDVLIAVQDFFCCTPMPKNFKATSIALIPKDYSTISKWLCWGRLISDNILLAQELIHTLDEKRRYENVVYKLDMAKAYDRVQWQFLYNVLRKMGFNEKWIQLVKNCIEQCWFSVLVNGDKAGFFSSSRGLRQGDPISPSLFIILAEYLARGLDQLFHKNPTLRYYSKGGSDVNRLSFADDIIIFSNASRRSIRKIVDFLDSYQRISGQLINIGKSSFIVGNKCSSLIKQRIQNITGFVSQSLPLTYLGTPLHKGNKKCILYDDLITRMRAKLLGWKQSMLSHGGRLALIKSTLCSMPLHLIQVLNPPKAILHCIE